MLELCVTLWCVFYFVLLMRFDSSVADVGIGVGAAASLADLRFSMSPMDGTF